MRRLLGALLIAAWPASAQVAMVGAPCKITDGSCAGTFTTIPPPASATLGCVGVFLGSPLALGCDAGLTYDAATGSFPAAGARRLPDGSMIYGAGTGALTPLCSYVGATVNAVTANYTDISAPANTCPQLQQGDIVAVTSAAVASNRGFWPYVGVVSTSIIGVLGVMTSPDNALNFTVYRDAAGISADGRFISSYRMTRPWRPAAQIGFYVDQTTGGNAGLEIVLTGRTPVAKFGDGETSIHPLRIYRGQHRSEAIFDVDALGNVLALGGLKAASGIATVGKLSVTGPAVPAAAPVVTAPASAPGSTTWTYRWVPVLSDGSASGRSPEGSLTTGPATLTSTDHIWVAFTCDAQTFRVDVYRTVAGGTPATTGFIGSAPCPYGGGATGFWDEGQAGDGTTAPTTNVTGEISVQRNITAGNDITSTGGTISATAAQNGATSIRVLNANTGTGPQACYYAGSSPSGTNYSSWCRMGSTFVTSGLNVAQRDVFRARGAGGLAVGTESNTPVILFANGAEVERVVPGAGMQSATGTKPTCDATTRFLKVPVAGGAGVADTYEICLKGTADTYAWYPLATAP